MYKKPRRRGKNERRQKKKKLWTIHLVCREATKAGLCVYVGRRTQKEVRDKWAKAQLIMILYTLLCGWLAFRQSEEKARQTMRRSGPPPWHRVRLSQRRAAAFHCYDDDDDDYYGFMLITFKCLLRARTLLPQVSQPSRARFSRTQRRPCLCF